MPRAPTVLLLVALIPATTALIAPTTLHIHAEDPPNTTAGRLLEHDLIITVQGPTGPTPTSPTPIHLNLTTPNHTNCHLPNTTHPDPLTGEANATLACTPQRTGHHPLHITAHQPPHKPDTWEANLHVTPDTLIGSLYANEPDGYEIPLTLEAQAKNLDRAPATLTLHGHLHDPLLPFHKDPQPVTLHDDWATTTNITALHGPGTYTLTANITSPHAHPLALTETITIPKPPSNDTAHLDVIVHQGPTRLAFDNDGEDREDSVNRDDVNKNPGDEIITRLATENTPTVNITVLRTTNNATIVLHHDEHEVQPDGTLEHRFAHDPLPAQRLHIQATAGNATLTRTAQIQPIKPSATLTLPEATIADGRPIQAILTLHDRNHGSTPQDPGPIWSLPDLDYTLFQGGGSKRAHGWNLTLGPIQDGPEGYLPTSRIPWPQGTPWATSTPGEATMNLTLHPAPIPEPNTYRLSLYEHNTSTPRIAGASIDLQKPPTVHLEASPPHPGETLPVNVTLNDALPGTKATVTTFHGTDKLHEATIDANTTLQVPLPETLPHDDVITLEATANWPHRPPAPGPDERLELDIPPLPPHLSVHPTLDGAPTTFPIPAHPAGEHTIDAYVQTRDPHGGDVNVTFEMLDPNGSATGWANDAEPGTITIPQGAPSGRYELVATAKSDTGTTVEQGAVEIGRIVRLSLSQPEALELQEGKEANVTFTLTNTGTAPIDQVLLQLDASQGLTLQAEKNGKALPSGELVPWRLDPGQVSQFHVGLVAGDDAQGSHEVEVAVAGVAS